MLKNSQYDLETKIREIVAELASPALTCAQQCMEEVSRLNSTMDEHHLRVIKQQSNFDLLDVQLNNKFNEMQSCIHKVQRIEADYQMRDTLRNAELLSLKGEVEQLSILGKQRETSIEMLVGQTARACDEAALNTEKISAMRNEMQDQISEFIRDQVNGFVDLRGNTQMNREDIVFLKHSATQHGQFFDNLSIELETFKMQKDGIKRSVEMLLTDMSHRVHRDQLGSITDRIETTHRTDHELLVNQIREFSAEFRIFQQETEDRFQLVSLEQQHQLELLNKQRQSTLVLEREIHKMFDGVRSHISEVQTEFSKNEEVWQLTFKQFSETLFNHSSILSELKANIRKDIIRMQQELEGYRSALSKQIIDEFRIRSAEFKREVITQMSDQLNVSMKVEISAAINEFEKQLESQRKEVRDVELQVIISDPIQLPPISHRQRPTKQGPSIEEVRAPQINYDLIQEMIERTLFELISDCLQQSKVLKEQVAKEVQKTQQGFLQHQTFMDMRAQLDSHKIQHTVLMEQIQGISRAQANMSELMMRGDFGTNPQTQEASHPIDSEQSISISLRANQMAQQIETELRHIINSEAQKLEDLKEEVTILNELRHELSNRVQYVLDQLAECSIKTEKYYTQVVKIKSDYINEQEYVLAQVNQVQRENTNLHRLVATLGEQMSFLRERLCQTIAFQLNHELQHSSQSIRVQSIIDSLLYEFKPGQLDEKTHITFKSIRQNRVDLLIRTLNEFLQPDALIIKSQAPLEEEQRLSTAYRPSKTYQDFKTSRVAKVVEKPRFAGNDRKITVRRMNKQQEPLRELSMDGGRSNLFQVSTPSNIRSPKSDFSVK